jgi:hypothetical protein
MKSEQADLLKPGEIKYANVRRYVSLKRATHVTAALLATCGAIQSGSPARSFTVYYFKFHKIEVKPEQFNPHSLMNGLSCGLAIQTLFSAPCPWTERDRHCTPSEQIDDRAVRLEF